MGFILTFDAPFFEGGISSSVVPGLYDVAVAGIPFVIDHTTVTTRLGQNQWQSTTIPLLKPQQDSQATPGEHSLSSDGLWRRAMESWHLGAGQSYLDRPDSDPARFRSSKGIDPSVRWQMSLLPDTARALTVAGSNPYLAVAGDRLYFSDGQALKYLTSLGGSATAVTGTYASSVASITSDGFHVFAAYANGIAKTDTSTSAATSAWSALIADVIGYHKGYLVAGVDNKLYSVNATGASTLLFTHLNDQFSFVDLADGPNAIYAAGFAGDKSIIYRIPFKTDGSGLDVAFPAGELPDGEIVRSIQGYLGFIVLGTDLGVRFCETDSTTGALSVGALIPTSQPVRCFEGQDRFVWFGMTDYDAASTGLGRLDLEFINAGPAPAYWSDLMADGQGDVVAVATFDDKRVFSVAAGGLYYETTNRVESGTIDSGAITYTLPDLKTAVAVDIRHRTLEAGMGTYSEWISVDADAFTQIGAHSDVLVAAEHGSTFSAGQRSGETIELRSVLTRGSDDLTVGPILTRVTLKALPKANTQQQFTVPVVIGNPVLVLGQSKPQRPNFILRAMRAIRSEQQVVNYQEFDETYAVVIDDLTFYRDTRNPKGDEPRGTLVLVLKTLDASG